MSVLNRLPQVLVNLLSKETREKLAREDNLVFTEADRKALTAEVKQALLDQRDYDEYSTTLV